jgi:hypothetical protein
MANEPVLSKNDIAKAVLAFLFAVASTAIGFFLALYFNNKKDIGKERDVYHNIRKAIFTESVYNQKVMTNSFDNFIDSGYVLNDLNTKVSTDLMKNSSFLKYADSGLLISVQNYDRLCELCNQQKEELKRFGLHGSVEDRDYAETIRAYLKASMALTNRAIVELQEQLRKKEQ